MSNKTSLFSRRQTRPSFCHHHAKQKTQPLARRKARGAERRKTQSNYCPPRKQVCATSAACPRSGRRRAAEHVACATPLLAGRARLPAHRCGSRQGFDLLTQLQAMLRGMFARRALPAGSQAQCRDSTSRRGRSTAGGCPKPPGTRAQTYHEHFDCDFFQYLIWGKGNLPLSDTGNTIGSITRSAFRQPEDKSFFPLPKTNPPGLLTGWSRWFEIRPGSQKLAISI